MAKSQIYQSLLQSYADDEKLMDRLEKAIFQSADAQRRALVNALDDAIESMLIEDGFIRPSAQNKKIIEDIQQNIDQLLRDYGLDDVQSDVLSTYQTRLDTLDDLVTNAGLDAAAGIDFRNLPEIQEQIEQFTSKLDNAVPEIGEIVRNEMLAYRGMIDGSKVSFSDFRKTLVNKAGILPRYAGTVGNTNLMAIDRVGRLAQADRAGIKKMKYKGVLDGLTRKFCRQHLGEVRPIKEWQNMQNNVNPQPVSKYCGGWNCRHRLLMYRDEWENDTQSQSLDRMWDNRLTDRSDLEVSGTFKEEMNIFLQGARPDVEFDASGSSYSVRKNRIKFSNLNDNSVRRRTVYHEYGHAVHHQTGLMSKGRFNDTLAGSQKFLDAADRAYEEINNIVRDIVGSARYTRQNAFDFDDGYMMPTLADELGIDYKRDRLFYDQLKYDMNNNSAAARKGDEIGTFSDMVDYKYNGDLSWGHSKDYWNQRKLLKDSDGRFTKHSRAYYKEMFAHAFEIRYKENSFIKDNFPKLYKIIKEDMNEAFDELLEAKRQQIQSD